MKNAKTIEKKITQILFILIIAFQLIYTTYIFVTKKEGFHSDEIYSYGLSNSYYQPFFPLPADGDSSRLPVLVTQEDGRVRLDVEDANIINSYCWISGSTYRDYLTVQPDERFAYGSVIYNQRLDVHPPLYYMLLHTICSLFPDSFSVWYAYFINIFALISTQIFLYLTSKRISQSSYTALLCCLLYAGSAGALDTFLFLRQYSLLTMLCMAFTYFSAELYYLAKAKGKKYRHILFAAIFVAYTAFLTHYYSIIYIGTFSAFLCLLLLLKRHFRAMLAYGFGMLGALGLFLASWAVIFTHSNGFSTGIRHYHSTRTQFKMLIRHLCRNCLGINISMYRTPFWNIVLPPVFILIVLILVLLFPFRKESWFSKLLERCKRAPKDLIRFLYNADHIPLITIFSSLSIYILSANIVNLTTMGEHATRYIMLTFPPLCMVSVIFTCYILKYVPRINRLAYVIATALVCIIITRTHLYISEPLFIYPHFGQEKADTAELMRDKNVLVVYDRSLQHTFAFSNWITPYLINAKNIFVSSSDVLEYYKNDITELNEPVNYVIIASVAFNPNEENLPNVAQMYADYLRSPYTASSSITEYLYTTSENNGYFSDNSTQLPEVGEIDCSSVIESLCDTYHILYGLNIQSVMYYVIELN